MPPKKKKGKKKGKGGKKKEVASSGPAAVRGPESLQAESLLQRQSLEQQIAVLKARCESLRQHNDDLKIKRSKGEKDTHEFVAYFQKELEKTLGITCSLRTGISRFFFFWLSLRKIKT